VVVAIDQVSFIYQDPVVSVDEWCSCESWRGKMQSYIDFFPSPVRTSYIVTDLPPKSQSFYNYS